MCTYVVPLTEQKLKILSATLTFDKMMRDLAFLLSTPPHLQPPRLPKSPYNPAFSSLSYLMAYIWTSPRDRILFRSMEDD